MPNDIAPRESETSLAELRGDCARMAPRWVAATRTATEAAARPAVPSVIHGVAVPPSSARLVGAMSEYGD
ncbi:hypothetical protein [Streptomyces sp. NRRL WC-3549]|uniref:hypothetical protein n=1 Tax=Streptomyces sp. NRRL WC-3549 TaxID=1463925 RepID=UPI0004C96C81|nr:hypothetical protein [Streptomyces sp. NRRL WC-3549]